MIEEGICETCQVKFDDDGWRARCDDCENAEDLTNILERVEIGIRLSGGRLTKKIVLEHLLANL